MQRIKPYLLGILRWLILVAAILTMLALLSGCAAQAPQPCQTVPSALVSDTSQSAVDFSQRVREFLQRAASWSEGLTQTGQQSEGS